MSAGASGSGGGTVTAVQNVATATLQQPQLSMRIEAQSPSEWRNLRSLTDDDPKHLLTTRLRSKVQERRHEYVKSVLTWNSFEVALERCLQKDWSTAEAYALGLVQIILDECRDPISTKGLTYPLLLILNAAGTLVEPEEMAHLLQKGLSERSTADRLAILPTLLHLLCCGPLNAESKKGDFFFHEARHAVPLSPLHLSCLLARIDLELHEANRFQNGPLNVVAAMLESRSYPLLKFHLALGLVILGQQERADVYLQDIGNGASLLTFLRDSAQLSEETLETLKGEMAAPDTEDSHARLWSDLAIKRDYQWAFKHLKSYAATSVLHLLERLPASHPLLSAMRHEILACTDLLERGLWLKAAYYHPMGCGLLNCLSKIDLAESPVDGLYWPRAAKLMELSKVLGVQEQTTIFRVCEVIARETDFRIFPFGDLAESGSKDFQWLLEPNDHDVLADVLLARKKLLPKCEIETYAEGADPELIFKRLNMACGVFFSLIEVIETGTPEDQFGTLTKLLQKIFLPRGLPRDSYRLHDRVTDRINSFCSVVATLPEFASAEEWLDSQPDLVSYDEILCSISSLVLLTEVVNLPPMDGAHLRLRDACLKLSLLGLLDFESEDEEGSLSDDARVFLAGIVQVAMTRNVITEPIMVDTDGDCLNLLVTNTLLADRIIRMVNGISAVGPGESLLELVGYLRGYCDQEGWSVLDPIVAGIILESLGTGHENWGGKISSEDWVPRETLPFLKKWYQRLQPFETMASTHPNRKISPAQAAVVKGFRRSIQTLESQSQHKPPVEFEDVSSGASYEDLILEAISPQPAEKASTPVKTGRRLTRQESRRVLTAATKRSSKKNRDAARASSAARRTLDQTHSGWETFQWPQGKLSGPWTDDAPHGPCLATDRGGSKWSVTFNRGVLIESTRVEKSNGWIYEGNMAEVYHFSAESESLQLTPKPLWTGKLMFPSGRIYEGSFKGWDPTEGGEGHRENGLLIPELRYLWENASMFTREEWAYFTENLDLLRNLGVYKALNRWKNTDWRKSFDQEPRQAAMVVLELHQQGLLKKIHKDVLAMVLTQVQNDEPLRESLYGSDGMLLRKHRWLWNQGLPLDMDEIVFVLENNPQDELRVRVMQEMAQWKEENWAHLLDTGGFCAILRFVTGPLKGIMQSPSHPLAKLLGPICALVPEVLEPFRIEGILDPALQALWWTGVPMQACEVFELLHSSDLRQHWTGSGANPQWVQLVQRWPEPIWSRLLQELGIRAIVTVLNKVTDPKCWESLPLIERRGLQLERIGRTKSSHWVIPAGQNPAALPAQAGRPSLSRRSTVQAADEAESSREAPALANRMRVELSAQAVETIEELDVVERIALLRWMENAAGGWYGRRRPTVVEVGDKQWLHSHISTASKALLIVGYREESRQSVCQIGWILRGHDYNQLPKEADGVQQVDRRLTLEEIQRWTRALNSEIEMRRLSPTSDSFVEAPAESSSQFVPSEEPRRAGLLRAALAGDSWEHTGPCTPTERAHLNLWRRRFELDSASESDVDSDTGLEVQFGELEAVSRTAVQELAHLVGFPIPQELVDGHVNDQPQCSALYYLDVLWERAIEHVRDAEALESDHRTVDQLIALLSSQAPTQVKS